MTPTERRKWNQQFAAVWQELQKHGPLQLSSPLARAARDLRDKGQMAGQTAGGLYWGTVHGQQAQAEQLLRLKGKRTHG